MHRSSSGSPKSAAASGRIWFGRWIENAIARREAAAFFRCLVALLIRQMVQQNRVDPGPPRELGAPTEGPDLLLGRRERRLDDVGGPRLRCQLRPDRPPRDKLMFHIKLRVPREMVLSCIERIRSGVPGMGGVRPDDMAIRPAFLDRSFSPGTNDRPYFAVVVDPDGRVNFSCVSGLFVV